MLVVRVGVMVGYGVEFFFLGLIKNAFPGKGQSHFSLTHCLLATSDTPNVMHELVELHFLAVTSSGNFFACSAFCLDVPSLGDA